MNQEKIGQLIRTVRKEKGFTQEEMAERLNVSQKSVSRWENGYNLPDVSLWNELCDLLEISLTELIEGERLLPDQRIEKAEKKIVEVVMENDMLIKRRVAAVIVSLLLAVVLFAGRRLLLEAKSNKMTDLFTQISFNNSRNEVHNIIPDDYLGVYHNYDVYTLSNSSRIVVVYDDDKVYMIYRESKPSGKKEVLLSPFLGIYSNDNMTVYIESDNYRLESGDDVMKGTYEVEIKYQTSPSGFVNFDRISEVDLKTESGIFTLTGDDMLTVRKDDLEEGLTRI